MNRNTSSVTTEATEQYTSASETSQFSTSPYVTSPGNVVTSPGNVVTSPGNVVTSPEHVATTHNNVATSRSTTIPAMTTLTSMSSPYTGITSSTPIQLTSTTESPCPWRYVSFGLIGGVALFLLVCIVLVVAICKLKRRLKKAHVTLYPVARADDHSYTPLAPPVKKGLALEMSSVTQVDEVEVIDSPTFSAPASPPTFNRSESRRDDNAPGGLSGTDKPPPTLPSRRPKKIAPFVGEMKSKANGKYNAKVSSDSKQLTLETVDDQDGGVENPGFETEFKSEDEPDAGSIVNVDYEDENDIYESYDHRNYINMTIARDTAVGETNVAKITDGEMSYEVPVQSNNEKANQEKDFIRRQSSSSGLPGFVFNLNEINEIGQDIYDNDEVEIKDTGLPASSNPLEMSEPGMYEDVENNMPQGERNSTSDSITGTYIVSEQNDYNVKSLHVDITVDDTSPLYDSGHIAYTTESDIESEPGMYYDDPEMDKASTDLKRIAVDDKSSENEETITTSPALPTSAIPIPKTTDEQNDPDSTLTPPKVPPRRDLVAQMSVSPPSGFNQIEEQTNGNIDGEDDGVQTRTDISDAEMRPGKRLSGINNNVSLEKSYFLDMEDGSKEISETQQKRISVHKMGDSEMSLTDLLTLYTADNTLGDANIKENMGVAKRNSETESETSEEECSSYNVSNGFLANGSDPNIADMYDDDKL